MEITPVIPDGYEGSIKQLTCHTCKHIFYITQTDYRVLKEVLYCHECSLIIVGEIKKSQGASLPLHSKDESAVSPGAVPVLTDERHNPQKHKSSLPFLQKIEIRVPQPRTIDRDKMTLKQLLEEAQMLDKTWRYQEALSSYEEAIQQNSQCIEAYYGKGEMLEKLDHSKDALALYDHLLSLDSTHTIRILQRRASIFISLRQYEEALSIYNEILQEDPTDLSVLWHVHIILGFLNRDNEADEVEERIKSLEQKETQSSPKKRTRRERFSEEHRLELEDRITHDPLHLDSYQEMGFLYTMRQEYAKVLEIYEKLLQSFPKHIKLHLEYIQALIRLENHNEALDACKKALQIDATCKNAYVRSGEILCSLHRYSEALEILDQGIELHPNSSNAYKEKAHVLVCLKRYEKALIAYDQAIALDPYTRFTYQDKAKVFVHMGRIEDALATHDQFIGKFPYGVEGYVWKTFFCIDEHRYIDGLATCDQWLIHYPYSPKAHERRGWMLKLLERYEEAMSSYEEAIRLDSTDADLHVSKAQVLICTKKYEEALVACEEAIRLDPNNASAHKEKGYALVQLDHYEDAVSAYLKVAQLNLDDAYEQREIGKILGILKQYKEALKAFDRAIHLDPHFISAYIGSADALKKLGRYEDALAVLNKILKYKPQDFNLLFARAQIWKKLMRYEESNKEFKRLESLAYHEYDAEIKRPDRIKIRVVSCMFAQVNLEERTKAKERLQTAGKEISDDAIEEEIKLMMEEEKKQKELSSSQSSPLFQPVLLFMQEKQKWSGTSKQFKEAICLQSPDTFTWKAPSKFVNELEKSTLALQEEGIVVTVLPKPTVITLTRVAMKESPEMG